MRYCLLFLVAFLSCTSEAPSSDAGATRDGSPADGSPETDVGIDSVAFTDARSEAEEGIGTDVGTPVDSGSDGAPVVDSGPDWVPAETSAGDPRFAFRMGRVSGACDTDNPFGFSLGDWNNDGWPDMQVWSHGRTSHCQWTNDGDGTFSVAPAWTALTSPFFAFGWSVLLADFDGDGDLDASGRTTEGHDGWMENTTVSGATPSGVFHRTHAWGDGSEPTFVDIDGDGDIEVIDEGPTIYHLEDDERPTVLGSTELSPIAIDLEGDGDIDLLMPTGTHYRNRGDGTFETFVDGGLEGCATRNAFVFDVNLDGDLDITCYAPGTDNLWVVRNQGGRLIPGARAEIGFRALDAVATKAAHAVADFNNDGLVDLMILGRTSRFTNVLINRGDRWERLGATDVLPGSGSDRFGARPTSAPADYDLDGRIDLITQEYNATAAEPGTATLYRNETSDAGHYLQLVLSAEALGNGGNRSAIGAWVEAFVPGTDERVGSSFRVVRSFQQMTPDFVHLGTDTHAEVDLRIAWPSNGGTEFLRNVRTNQRLVIRYAESGSAVGPWAPGDLR